MKRFYSLGMASLLAAGLLAGCAAKPAAPESADAVTFDFEEDDAGFTAIYADYPEGEGVESDYGFQHSYGKVPVEGAGNGIFISGNNLSADLFMGYVKALDGFEPGETYHFTVSFRLATDVEGGLVGAGSSPGEGVTVKCGVTPTEPIAVAVNEGGSGFYRLNIDAGSQSGSGKDMTAVGDMAKTESGHPGEYEWKEFRAEFDVAANEQGRVYLIIGTDSGFEGTTSWYLDDISVGWV